MYTKEEREGILWEFHRSGLDVRSACRGLPLFPNADNLYWWLRTGWRQGELETRDMPDKLRPHALPARRGRPRLHRPQAVGQ